jgi:hypothetical protein
MRTAIFSIVVIPLIAASAFAQKLAYCGQVGSKTGDPCLCSKYDVKTSTLIDLECETNAILGSALVPRERFNEKNNTVGQFDPVTGKLLKAFPANDYYPAYGLSLDDLGKLDQLCEAPVEREGDQRRWCLSTRKAERVRNEYQQLWLAIPNVSNISVGMVGNQSDFVVGLTLQIKCPRDVAAVEARVPDEIDGVPIAVEPIPVGTALVAEVACEPETGTGKGQCYDVHQECDPYLDFETCKPHCREVRTKRAPRPAANPADTR